MSIEALEYSQTYLDQESLVEVRVRKIDHNRYGVITPDGRMYFTAGQFKKRFKYLKAQRLNHQKIKFGNLL